jgi:hypothetical protein
LCGQTKDYHSQHELRPSTNPRGRPPCRKFQPVTSSEDTDIEKTREFCGKQNATAAIFPLGRAPGDFGRLGSTRLPVTFRFQNKQKAENKVKIPRFSPRKIKKF